MSEESGTPAEAGARSKERSPNYPSIPLTQAIELANKWYEREKRTTVAPGVAAKALGYGALSGTARTVIASLRQYGLVENAKDGLRISDLAMEIIHQPIGSPERTNALRVAALNPPFISELNESHADASDDALRGYLVTKRKFAPEGAGRFIPAFREAVQIARLPQLASEAKPSGGRDFAYPPATPERIGWVASRAAANDSGEKMQFIWQLSGDVVATMSVSKQIEEDDVEVLIDNLEAAKKAIRKQAKLNAAKGLAGSAGGENAT